MEAPEGYEGHPFKDAYVMVAELEKGLARAESQLERDIATWDPEDVHAVMEDVGISHNRLIRAMNLVKYGAQDYRGGDYASEQLQDDAAALRETLFALNDRLAEARYRFVGMAYPFIEEHFR